MQIKLYASLTNLLIFLQGVLIFVLIFQNQLVLPLPFLGRLHPLILHLPIGFGCLLGFLFLVKGQVASLEFYRIFRFLLYLTSIFSAISALFGLFLSLETGYDTELIQFHQWLGIAVNGYYVLFLFLFEKNQVIGFWKSSLGSVLGIFLLFFAGHGGANLTHGEDFLFPSADQQVSITSKSIVFKDLVQPILKNKCESCHNDQKTKGQLNMSSVEKMLKGGKNGPLWKAGDVVKSHLIHRIELPMDAKEHMPPKGKSQLTENEILLLRLWVQSGASLDKSIQDYPAQLGFSKWISSSNASSSLTPVEKNYDFSSASESDIASVNTPFCSVRPISSSSPALEAEFFVAKKFDVKTLENLSKVATQLTALNIAKMPIKDSDVKLMAKFTHLERLNLNFTDISGKGLMELIPCQNLNSLSLAGTKIQEADLVQFLKKMGTINEVFIWNTNLNATQISQVKQLFPKIKWNEGYVPKNEQLAINPPILVNENLILKPSENLLFKHTLKGVDFHYSLNDSTPDSLGKLVTRGPIQINQFTKVKILATKAGWLASKMLELKVFKSRFVPDSVLLLTEPEPKFSAQGAYTLKNFISGARYTKGVPNHTWLGFRGVDFEAEFIFRKDNLINGLTYSYLEKTDEGVFPPTEIVVLAVDKKGNWNKIGYFRPEVPKNRNGFSNKAINIPLLQGNYSKIRIQAKSVKSLPKYLIKVENKIEKKEVFDLAGQPGKLRLDEILFY